MTSIRDFLYVRLYRLFSFLALRLPRPVIVHIAQTLAFLLWHLIPSRRHVILINLELAFPGCYSDEEKAAIGKASYTNFIMTALTLAQLEHFTPEEFLSMVEFRGEEHLRQALDEGKKIIFVTAHYGNWELTPPATTLRFGISCSIVGRRLDSEALHQIITPIRERFFVKIIDKHGATKGMINALNQGEAVGILVDQNITKRYGIPVEFFGHTVSHTPLASILARKFDAVLLPVFVSTEDHLRYTVEYLPPLPTLRSDDKERDIREMTQAQASVTEEKIRQKPELWLWMHKRWKAYHRRRYEEPPKEGS